MRGQHPGLGCYLQAGDDKHILQVSTTATAGGTANGHFSGLSSTLVLATPAAATPPARLTSRSWIRRSRPTG